MAEFNPDTLSTSERYKILSGAVIPRPIAWVSTCSPTGQVNLAPYSFYNAVGYHPMTVMFCPQLTNDRQEKDSLRNAKPRSEGGSGEFVINLTTEPLARAVAITAERLPSEGNEFELAGLEMAASVQVQAPRVKHSPVSFECRTVRVILNSIQKLHIQPQTSNL
ncbi:MAG: flavin reductase family protein, partial [Myxococcota bacterium]